MKRYWDCVQLRLKAPKDVKLKMLSRRAAFSGYNIAIIATFSGFGSFWCSTAFLRSFQVARIVGLMFYTCYLFLRSLFRQLPSLLTERHSTKLCHVFASGPLFTMHIQNLGCSLLQKWRSIADLVGSIDTRQPTTGFMTKSSAGLLSRNRELGR